MRCYNLRVGESLHTTFVSPPPPLKGTPFGVFFLLGCKKEHFVSIIIMRE